MSNLHDIEELIDRKINLAQEVFVCSENLSKIDCSNEPARFEHFLDKRAQLIESLSKTDIILKNQLKKLNAEELNQIQAEIEKGDQQLKHLLSRISEIDIKSKKHLEDGMAEIKNKLSALRKKAQGRKAYINQGRIASGGAFMDSRK